VQRTVLKKLGHFVQGFRVNLSNAAQCLLLLLLLNDVIVYSKMYIIAAFDDTSETDFLPFIVGCK
jgi:hypothetical protein